jgi:phage terminase large subunit-like protein
MQDFATEYAKSVTSKKIIAGPHVRAACRRHLKDLKEAGARGLHFDLEKANRIIEFSQEICCLNGGDFEGVPFDPLLWQKFILCNLFGWVKDDGTRRFRTAFVETSKGSGKSPLAGLIGIYGLVADNEPRAEVYAAATKKDQAMILFRDAVAMRNLSPYLKAKLKTSGTGANVWNLAYLEKGSFFRPISSDDGQSGPRPHIVLLDEVHEHKNSNTIEMLRAGTKGRRQALIFMITNSGHDKQSVCWNYHEYAIKVANGSLEDDSFFSYVCALDKDDEPFEDEDCWVKTNPSLGVTIQKDYIREQVTAAKGMPSKESVVRRLNFSQWVGASNPWLSYDIWMAAGDTYSEEELLGRRCYGGLDLSSVHDLTAMVLAFEPTEKDPNWRLLPYFWLPEEGLYQKGQRDGVDYITWVNEGYLHTTPGKAINKSFVCAKIAEISSKFNLVVLGYDRWRIDDLRSIMDAEGIDVNLQDFGQGYKDMAPAVDEFERKLLSGIMTHNNNPCLTWCAANAIIVSDPANNRKPDKAKSTGRIDGIVAAVMAVGKSLNADNFDIDSYIMGIVS